MMFNEQKIGQQEIPAIILAAGQGSRVGKNKALLEIKGIKFLEMIVSSLRKAGFDWILVVGGAEGDSVRKEAERLHANFALNEGWQRGQFSSLKTGLAKLGSGLRGGMVVLVDHPFVSSDTYRSLVSTFAGSPESIVIPTYEGKRGHPVIIPKEFIVEINEAPDRLTLRDIIRKHDRDILYQSVQDGGIVENIDSPEDLERARQKES